MQEENRLLVPTFESNGFTKKTASAGQPPHCMSTIDQYVANATQAVENRTHVEGKDCEGWHSGGLRQRCYKGYHVGVTNVNCQFFLSNQFLPWLFRRTKFRSLRKMSGAKDAGTSAIKSLVSTRWPRSIYIDFELLRVAFVSTLRFGLISVYLCEVERENRIRIICTLKLK
jgi:hypothetical protein